MHMLTVCAAWHRIYGRKFVKGRVLRIKDRPLTTLKTIKMSVEEVLSSGEIKNNLNNLIFMFEGRNVTDVIKKAIGDGKTTLSKDELLGKTEAIASEHKQEPKEDKKVSTETKDTEAIEEPKADTKSKQTKTKPKSKPKKTDSKPKKETKK